MRRLYRYTPGLALAVLPLLSFLMLACGSEPGASSGAPPPPTVTVAQPLSREITDWDEFTGRLQAVDRVEVRARVSGYLQATHFREGAIVDKGDLLFVIDPRPYQATVTEAEAQVTRAEVRLDLAVNDRDRAERLYASHAISEEEFDARTQEKREAEAALEAAKAAVQAARLDLEFTHVKAPIRGRISRALVTEGNLIRGGSADSTLLTTLVSMDPIHFYFTADEQAVLRYIRLSEEGSRPTSRERQTPAVLQLADEQGFPHQGYVDFVDNRIDDATGTMQARALFPNPNHLLVPGMFGKIKIQGRGPYPALLIPDEAVVTDQAEQIVYVVEGENTVGRRAVVLGPRVGGLRVVRSGLEGTDRVVISGVQRVRPGAPVSPETTSLEDRFQESQS